MPLEEVCVVEVSGGGGVGTSRRLSWHSNGTRRHPTHPAICVTERLYFTRTRSLVNRSQISLLIKY